MKNKVNKQHFLMLITDKLISMLNERLCLKVNDDISKEWKQRVIHIITNHDSCYISKHIEF